MHNLILKPLMLKLIMIFLYIIGIDDIDDDITGEITTSERRKTRSATQRAARRWWNTEAIDLELYLYRYFFY